ncbi:serine/threonine protein kinase [Streptomyces spongiicola]|uniref:non-specific serine/threonine protein kinase n=1 Tax=Streptomyces spongiicola TaxID=1690221 RepID=A0ABM6V8A3_9ACTN|nr:serine/threonine-protein kinase [Streptomyces spongiicola]AWK10131.1 serine/threonine protein kinase [Streptomyces spongiicola]
MGEVFAGRYELIDPIGRGGAGAVWRAWDHRRRRYVAAKVLQQSDAHSLLRFVREQALRIDHPHVLAPASWAADDDKVLFTMDLVGGGSLAHLIGDYGPLPPRFVCTLVDQLLSGLAAVHAEGVVHRDIKPANILLESTGTGRPHLRLSDFGISMRKGEPRLTETNYVVGTPGYFAPEQMLGAEPDFPADLFAVGLVALYLLQGRKPDSRALVEHFAEYGTPGAPEGVPEPLWQVLAGLLQPDPQARFRTATGARKALVSAVELLPDTTADDEPVEVFDQLGPLPSGFGPGGPGGPGDTGDADSPGERGPGGPRAGAEPAAEQADVHTHRTGRTGHIAHAGQALRTGHIAPGRPEVSIDSNDSNDLVSSGGPGGQDGPGGSNNSDSPDGLRSWPLAPRSTPQQSGPDGHTAHSSQSAQAGQSTGAEHVSDAGHAGWTGQALQGLTGTPGPRQAPPPSPSETGSFRLPPPPPPASPPSRVLPSAHAEPSARAEPSAHPEPSRDPVLSDRPVAPHPAQAPTASVPHERPPTREYTDHGPWIPGQAHPPAYRPSPAVSPPSPSPLPSPLLSSPPPPSVARRRPGPPPRVAIPVLFVALICFAVGIWAFAQT